MELQKRRDYRDLVLWQRAMELAVEVHSATLKLPRDELFGLAAQILRSAVSIPWNIAEGSGRRTTREFIAFLHIARGSLSELRTQLRLATMVGYFTELEISSAENLTDKVGKLLNAVLRGLRHRQTTTL
jgi:four helix bundle protein